MKPIRILSSGQPPSDAVQIAPAVLEDLNTRFQAAYKALPRRGLEIGGILAGRIAHDGAGHSTLFITSYESHDISHRSGPSYLLTEDEIRRLKTVVNSWPTRGGSDGVVAGFYRSHTRPDFGPDKADEALMNALFPHDPALFLLAKPLPDGRVEVACFAWEASAGGFRSVGPVQYATPAVASVRRRGKSRLAMAALGCIAGLIAYQTWTPGSSPASSGQFVAAAGDALPPAAPAEGEQRGPESTGTPVKARRFAKEIRPIETEEPEETTAGQRSFTPPPVGGNVSPALTSDPLPEPPSLATADDRTGNTAPDVPPQSAPFTPAQAQAQPPAIAFEIVPVRESVVRRGIEKVPGLNLLQRRRYKDGSRFEPARVAASTLPVLPESVASLLTTETPVDLRVTVERTGEVSDVDLVSATADRRLVPFAVRAIKTWQFEPAQLNSKNVSSDVIVHFRFRNK